MYRELKSRGIKFIVSQYPVRSANIYKKEFADYPDITIVDNEKIFKTALAEKGYLAYFSDMIGGDFGHCTPLGNRLLASNIADTVINFVIENH